MAATHHKDGDKALVAIEWLEFPDPKAPDGFARIAPGEPVPVSLDEDSLKELRKYKSIGTEQEYKRKVSDDDAAARRQRIRAQAEAEGMTVSEG